MEQRYFEDIDPGDEHSTQWQPNAESVQEYMSVAGRFTGGDGRFTDAEAAKKLGLPGAIAPGAFSLSVLSRVVNDWAGMLGRVGTVEVNFRRPVLHGDMLTAMALVTDVDDDASDPARGRVKLDVFLENERGERPVQGVAIVELPKHE